MRTIFVELMKLVLAASMILFICGIGSIIECGTGFLLTIFCIGSSIGAYKLLKEMGELEIEED